MLRSGPSVASTQTVIMAVQHYLQSGVTPIFKLLLCAQTNKRCVFGLFVSDSAPGFRHAIRTAVPLFPLVIE